MAKRKRYPKYKPSGAEWLGKVPEEWEIGRLKFAATYKVSNVDKVPSKDELPVRLCNYVDVYYNDFISPALELMETTATKDEIDRFHLHVDDVVITKDSEDWRDIAVPAVVVETAPNLVCGYHLAFVRPSQGKLVGKYLFRLFQSEAVNQQFQIAASGVTRYGLPKAAIGDATIPLPTVMEQLAIANFLDRETNKIDTLISKKLQLIEKLKERRTALITRTVTKGLPPEEAAKHGLPTNPKYKPSGVEWLGDVPQGWEVWNLSHAFATIGSGTTPRSDSYDFYDDGTIPWVTTSELRERVITDTAKKITKDAFQEHSALKLFPKGTLLFAMYGATIGRMGILGIEATTNQACCAFSGGVHLTERYTFYWLLMWRPVLLALSSGGGQPNLSQDDLREIRIPAPLPSEQLAIAEFLDRETSKIDEMISKVDQAITRLQEYRTSLITAAVTGKIDVRAEVECRA